MVIIQLEGLKYNQCQMLLKSSCLVQGAPAQSGSSGHSSMDASQSPSVSNSMDLLRQSSTVSGEGRNAGNALHVLKAAAARADQWRAANSGEAAGWPTCLPACLAQS